MKNLIKFSLIELFFTLFALSPISAHAESCMPALEITYSGGEKGCLTDLPLSKVIDKTWKRPIADVVKNSGYYAVSASGSCNIVSVASAGMTASLGVHMLQILRNNALSNCPKDCDCAIIIENGTVKLPKNLVSVIGLHRDANYADASLLNDNSSDKKNDGLKNTSGVIKNQEANIQNIANSENNKFTSAGTDGNAETNKKDKPAAELNRLRDSESTKSSGKDKSIEQAVEDNRKSSQFPEQVRLQTDRQLTEEQLQRQKDRELLAQLSAELAKLRAESDSLRQNNQANAAALKPLEAQPVATYANRKALVIGNDGYRFVSKLANAGEDARAMADNLSKVGYKVTLKFDQTEKEIKATLRSFKSQVEAGDEVAFFYAGHGIQISNVNYLLPIDVAGEAEDQIKDEAISLQRILDDMSDKKVKFTLAMIDACRDNPFKGNGRSIGGGSRGLAPTTAATGQMIIFSAGTGQQALDKLGPNDKDKNGLFTRLFIKEMQKPGVSIDQLVRNVRNQVVISAKAVGHDQVPAIYDQAVGDFYFRK